MTTSQYIWIEENGLPPDLYNEILALYPRGREGSHFRLESKPGQVLEQGIAERIVDLCESRRIRRSAGGEPGTYGFEVVRHYDDEDLRAAPLLLLDGTTCKLEIQPRRDSEGRLLVPTHKIASNAEFIEIYPSHLFLVSGALGQALKKAPFAGVTFAGIAPVQPQGLDHSLELESSIVLPKMKNSVLMPARPFECYGILDPPYRGGEPHYNRADVAEVVPFDLAKTREPLGQPRQAFVLSANLHRFLADRGISIRARPVHIDSE